MRHQPIFKQNFQQPIHQTLNQPIVQPQYYPSNSQVFAPQQNIPQYHSVQPSTIRCPMHPGETCKRLCSSIGCNKKVQLYLQTQYKVLLCSECFYEDPDHIKQHKDQIIPIGDFLQMIDRMYRSQVQSARESKVTLDLPPAVVDLSNNDEKYVQSLQSSLNTERRKLAGDFQTLFQVFQEQLDSTQESVQGELDYHYNNITQSLFDFKRTTDPSLSSNQNPKDQIENLLRTQNDFNILQSSLRTIRDRAINQGGKNLSDSRSFQQKCMYLAQRIKKSIQHPPRYTQIDPNIINEFTEKITNIFMDLQKRIIQNISLPPVEDDISAPDILSNYVVSQDALSVKLPIRDKLVLSQSPTILPTFHKDKINCIKAFESSYIASGGMDGLAMLWNIDNGDLVTTFQGHKGPITCLGVFKSTSKKNQAVENYLVSGSTDKNVILWDIDDENNTLVFKGHDDTVTTIMSLEDGSHLATGGADRKIIVWDIPNSKINCVLPCNGSIYQLHKMKSGGGKNYFFSCDHSQALNIFKVDYTQQRGSNKSLIITLEKVILTPCFIYGLTSSISNPYLLAGSASDKTVKVWNFNYSNEEQKFKNDQISKEYQGHKGGVAESIMVDTADSAPGNDDYFLITCGLNDERIIVKHSKSQHTSYYQFPGLKISEPFTSHKMQVIRNSNNEYKLVVVNQAPQNFQLLIWDMNDTRIL